MGCCKMQELLMIANFIDLDSKNFSTVMFYIVFSLSPLLPFEVIRMICLYAAQEQTQVRWWEENLGILIYRPRSAPLRGEAFLYRKNALSP